MSVKKQDIIPSVEEAITLALLKDHMSMIEKQLNRCFDRVDELRNSIGMLNGEIQTYKAWVKGAYYALGIAITIIMVILTRTGIMTRIFGG